MSQEQKDAAIDVGVETRREFLKKSSIFPAASVLIGGDGVHRAPAQNPQAEPPWYRRTLRWGQTNISEEDPSRYDIEWWRQHWKRTRIQGVIINAGGIVAYYPSRFLLQHRAENLRDRDLLGQLTEAARKDGLVVLARMDSNRAHEPLFKTHPDWFAVDAEGKPYKAGELYVSCISSPYYEEYIPGILREIYGRIRPEGFTDNSWSGLDRENICFCRYCSERFQAFSGEALPKRKDWESQAYRRWIQWNYARRLEIWDLNNRIARNLGGADCLWIGMIGGDVTSQSRSFRDIKAICERAGIIMFDDQGRNDRSGFQSNGEMGKRIHGLLGWDKLIPESMAMYLRNPTFRKAANPVQEARLWMLEGIAGTIQPWWHHVGAFQEDRRQFLTSESVCRWHEANQSYLVNRRPIATVGVVWSQTNVDFYGRDDAENLTILPYRGICQALLRARIPYLPVHADHISRDADRLDTLILPNLAAVSQRQVEAIRRFADRGGGVIASGETSLYDEWGDRRPDFALADLFGVHTAGRRHGPNRSSATDHSYLRLIPDVASDVYGPRPAIENRSTGRRHETLRGFEETNIIPFGGWLEEVKIAPDTHVTATLIPSFPIYPPETSWMRIPRTDIPGLVLRESKSGARVAYLPADIDRRFALANLPDHANLISNITRWVARGAIPLSVAGPGLVDCHLYQQPGRMILHFVNLTNDGSWRSPVYELIPVGPLTVKARLERELQPKKLVFLVSGEERDISIRDGWVGFEIKSLLDHEVVVIT